MFQAMFYMVLGYLFRTRWETFFDRLFDALLGIAEKENFKNLRNALKASNFRVSELETELKAKEEELKKLDSVS